MQYLKVCLLSSIAVLLIGCANKPADTINCKRINWYQLGYQDVSQKAHYRQNLATRFPLCGPNLIVNKTQYHAGWTAGIKAYCLPENGFQLGKEGKMYNTVCPPNQATDFEMAWRTGLKSFCIPHNAYLLGLDGKKFPNFCEQSVDSAFASAYHRGAKQHHQLVSIKEKFNQATTELTGIQQQRKEMQQALYRMRLHYSQQPFSPQTQYQIQEMTIKVRHLVEKENTLETVQQQYQDQYDSLRHMLTEQ